MVPLALVLNGSLSTLIAVAAIIAAARPPRRRLRASSHGSRGARPVPEAPRGHFFGLFAARQASSVSAEHL